MPAPIVDTILHEYPYPIAKCYERLLAAHDVVERLERTRFLFEVTLKYAACVALAGYLNDERRDERTDAAISLLTRPSMGHWLNLFRTCARHQQTLGNPHFPDALFDKIRDRPGMTEAYVKIRNFLDDKQNGAQQSVTLLGFLEAAVAYRNRTTGHGAPRREQLEEMSPVLEAGVVELIGYLDFLRRTQLVHLSDLRVERRSFVHHLVRMMGTTQVAIAHYTTDRDQALLGADKQLFLCAPDTTTPVMSLHPLVICAQGEVFLLQSSDLDRGVEYICHHTGQFYVADRLYEDFKDRFGSMLGGAVPGGGIDADEVYRTSVRISLVDGVVADEEREHLNELRVRLNLTEARAGELESSATRERAGAMKAEESASGPPAGAVSVIAPEHPRVLFLSYASVRIGFWADFVSRLAAQSHRRGMVFSMVAVDPSEDHDPSAMMALIAEIGEIIDLHKPDVMVVAPAPIKAFGDLFTRQMDRFRTPLVVLDSPIAPARAPAGSVVGAAPLVQLDNVEAGRMAGRELARHAAARPGPHQLLVLPGMDSAKHSDDRVHGFKEGVAAELPAARVKQLSAAGFDRAKARLIFEEFIADADLGRFQGIFCCSDEMALGVYASILRDSRARTAAQGFGIIGFNNTDEMQTALQVDNTGLLLGTIDQNLGEYVNTVFEVIESQLRGERGEAARLILPCYVGAPQPEAAH